MPELAEVETFRRQLSPLLVDKAILSFESSHPRSIRRHKQASEIVERIVGKKVVSVRRHGKYLSIEIEGGDYLNAHLRMSGRFLVFEKSKYNSKKNPKHSHVIFETDQHVFVFVDPRTFGELWVTKGETPELKKGEDAFESTISRRGRVWNEIKTSKRSVKSILLDQNILSGIGNIYADEICADAQIKPTRSFSSLSAGEIDRLNQSCGNVLTRAVELRGSSLRDESFKDLYGEIGKFQTQHVVHARKNCARCDREISKTKVAGRSTYFCEFCQK